MSDFLLEIGTDEIPARMIASATEELQRRLGELVTRERLAEKADVEAYSTPRRIAVIVHGLTAAQPDAAEQMLGPGAAHAFKDGQPTKAAESFAKKAGVALSELITVTNLKGMYVAANVVHKGRPAKEILGELVPKEISALYWAKNMYWRLGKPERFVRPVRWLVALLDGEVVPLEFAGITAGKTSRGHRILATEPVEFTKPTDYAEKLRAAHVLPSYAEREHKIRKALDAATRAVAGARWREDKGLLDTVVQLTEAPSVILGNFDEEFLALPEEVLVTVMRDHQKYFAVEDASGKLAPHWLAVLNTVTDAEGEAIIRHGNERVLRARFKDARFFWETDQQHTLKDRVAMLKNVTFQKELGSYYDKATRTQHLGSQISAIVTEYYPQHRQGVVYKAALMAKCDLTTELVKEFTELQGIIGGLYLVHQAERMDIPEGSAAAIGEAIYDQYKPASMEDDVPRSLEGAVLALADKADTIAGMFALGMIPSGSKDPFALRRAANGMVRILVEHKLPLNVVHILEEALRQYAGSAAEKHFTAVAEFKQNVTAFFRERLEFYLRDARGFAYDVTNAVLAEGAENVLDAVARAEAVAKVRGSEDFNAISASVKRIKNILRQAHESEKFPAFALAADFVPQAANDDAERALAAKTAALAVQAGALCSNKQYDEALAALATIRRPLDGFFDKVMVMVDDDTVRGSRLALLQKVNAMFQAVADFSEVVTGTKAS
ncbi:MAG: glycine--tRNA ligase subunit beta [Acidobacteriota bacterium]|nr:glycine--tRNA ligase subunit beta [Acidobacteriota bacterium]